MKTLMMACLVLASSGCVASQTSSSSRALSEIAINTLELGEDSLLYASSGDNSKPGVLFVHGTPGSWSAFESYLKNKSLQTDFFMASVDRPGWGGSATPGKRIDGDFHSQAFNITRIFDQYPKKKWTVVGHSLGASLAPEIAMQAPDKVQALLLLAGSVDPRLGKPRWFNRLANNWVVSRIIGKSMRISNREIISLENELKVMSAKLKESDLNIKLIAIQGQQDRLVSPDNTNYIMREWQTKFSSIEVINLEKEGHFLPWRQAPLIIQMIRKLNAG